MHTWTFLFTSSFLWNLRLSHPYGVNHKPLGYDTVTSGVCKVHPFQLLETSGLASCYSVVTVTRTPKPLTLNSPCPHGLGVRLDCRFGYCQSSLWKTTFSCHIHFPLPTTPVDFGEDFSKGSIHAMMGLPSSQPMFFWEFAHLHLLPLLES